MGGKSTYIELYSDPGAELLVKGAKVADGSDLALVFIRLAQNAVAYLISIGHIDCQILMYYKLKSHY